MRPAGHLWETRPSAPVMTSVAPLHVLAWAAVCALAWVAVYVLGQPPVAVAVAVPV